MLFEGVRVQGCKDVEPGAVLFLDLGLGLKIRAGASLRAAAATRPFTRSGLGLRVWDYIVNLRPT